jgi:hypothetical protein
MKTIFFRAVTIAALLLFVGTSSPFAALPDGAAVLSALATNDALLAMGGVTMEGTKVQLPGKIRFQGGAKIPGEVRFPPSENRREGT